MKKLVVASITFALLGMVATQVPAQVSDRAGGTPVALPSSGAPGTPGPMTITSKDEALSILSFDDSSCEGGLGFIDNRPMQAVMQFDVPTQCTQAGLDIVGLTARINTVGAGGAVSSLVLHNDTATPGVTADAVVAVAGISGLGPCPAAASHQFAAVAPGSAVVNNTVSFFAGVGGAGLFTGRDTSAPDMRHWLIATGSIAYSPGVLSGAGFGGDWHLRVTVEDQNCIPVELTGFSLDN